MRMTVTSFLLMLMAGLGSGPSLDAGAQRSACGSEIQTAEINGATLHYFECGKGEPLVFVHGGLGDLHTFRAQVQTFAAKFRVIAYSRRFSPPNAPPRATDVNPLSNHRADLRALIGQLKAAPARVVANSYGAYIALALAVDHPELVRSLVLGEPPIFPLIARTAVGEALGQSWLRLVIGPSRKEFESGNLEGGLRAFFDAIVAPGAFANLPPSVRSELVEKQAPELRSQFMTEGAANLPPLDCGKLGKLSRPTLLVTGERSPAALLLISAELERCLEGEAHVMVPEAGHTPQRENAAFYNNAVMAFLQRN